MKKNLASEKNDNEKKSRKRWWVAYIKKAFNYLLLLSLLESGIANAQSNGSLQNEWNKRHPASGITITDHENLIHASVDSLDIETIRNETLLEINKERAKKKLAPLVLNKDLNKAAEEHGKYMNVNNWYKHKDKNWVGGNVRAKKHGYKKIFMWENIHQGPRSIYYVMKDWMLSDGHKGNILWEFSEEVGIYYENGYWVLVFGGRYPWIGRGDTK